MRRRVSLSAGQEAFLEGHEHAFSVLGGVPLPDAQFETGRWFALRVDRHSQITVRTNRYSVPVRLAGRQVRVQLHASHLQVYCDRQLVATHERLPGKAETRLELDHHLEILLRKPGALPGSTALEQARAAGRFTPVHDAWWAAAREAHGDSAGTRELIGVLLSHRHLSHELVVIGLARALAAGAVTADAVILEARKAAEDNTSEQLDEQPATDGGGSESVASLTARRLTALPADTRPPPSVAAYDALLRNPRKTPQTHEHDDFCEHQFAAPPRADRASLRCRRRAGLPHAATADDPHQLRRLGR